MKPLSAEDRNFLGACGIAIDVEDWFLQREWIKFADENKHRDTVEQSLMTNTISLIAPERR